jgi:hypothetical protein
MFLQVCSRRAPREIFGRLAEWWPAALIGTVALLTGLPEGNAQSLLGL